MRGSGWKDLNSLRLFRSHSRHSGVVLRGVGRAGMEGIQHGCAMHEQSYGVPIHRFVENSGCERRHIKSLPGHTFWYNQTMEGEEKSFSIDKLTLFHQAQFGFESDAILREVWKRPMVVLDSSAWLSMDGLNSQYLAEITGVITQFSESIFVPTLVAIEYLANVSRVHDEKFNAQSVELDALRAAITTLEANLDHQSAHSLGPIVDAATSHRVLDTLALLKQSCQDEDRLLRKNRAHSNFNVALGALTGGFRLDALSDSILARLNDEGPKRFASNIPPGYHDNNKKGNIWITPSVSIPRKFADLAIWFQILELDLSGSTGLVFVTDDGKSDWWIEGDALPRRACRELCMEFHESHPGTRYRQLTFLQFIEEAKEHWQVGDVKFLQNPDFDWRAALIQPGESQSNRSKFEKWIIGHVTQMYTGVAVDVNTGGRVYTYIAYGAEKSIYGFAMPREYWYSAPWRDIVWWMTMESKNRSGAVVTEIHFECRDSQEASNISRILNDGKHEVSENLTVFLWVWSPDESEYIIDGIISHYK